MNNNNNKESNTGVKSAILSGLIITPSLIGLGLGAKNAITNIQANTPNFTPMTGGQPNHLEMIGRSIGSRNRSGNINISLNSARANLAKGLSNLNSGNFRQSLESGGPRRNALILAYRRMLNSPVLGLSPEAAQSEMNDVLSSMESKSGSEFADEMTARIRKKSLEFGSDRGGEFFTELEKEFKNQLKFEESIEKNGTIIDLATLNTESNIKTHRLSNGEIENIRTYTGNDDVSKRTKQSLEELENILSNQGLKNHEFSIYRIQDSRQSGVSYVARITSNTASFDVPLALRRTGLAKGAPGGHTFISSSLGNNVSYRTSLVVGSQMTSITNPVIPQGEDVILRKFKESISKMNNVNIYQAKDIAEEYTKNAFGGGQMLSSYYTKAQEALSSMHAWALDKAPEFIPGNIEHETKIRSNKSVKPFNVTVDQITEGRRYAVGAPTIEETLEYYNPMSSNVPGNIQLTADIPLTSRLHAQNRETTIVGSNKPLNRLGWTNRSMIGFKGKTDLARQLIETEKDSKRTSLAFYQFEDSGDTYMHRLKTGEGTYLGTPSNYRLTAASKKDIMPLTKEGKGTPLMHYLIEKAKQANGGPLDIRLTRKELSKYGMTLGRDSSFNPINFNLESHMQSIIIKDLRTNKNGNLDISWEFEVTAGSRVKINSASYKGTMLKPKDKNLISSEVNRVTKDAALAQRLVKDYSTVVIAGDKQISRTPLELRSSMIYGAQHILSTETNLSEKEILEWGSHSRWGRISTDAAAALVAHKLTKEGVSPQGVSLAVAGAYRHTSDRGKQAIRRAVGNTSSYVSAIENATGFFGLSTYSIGKSAELQGAGKPGTFERRTIHGLLQNLKSTGLNDTDATTIISDVMSRIGTDIPYHKLVTARTFGTATLSTASPARRIDDLRNLSKMYNMDFATESMSSSRLKNFNLKGESWYRNTNVVSFTFDSKKSGEAARRTFGSTEILIPGLRGMPGFETVKGRRGSDKVTLMNDYDKSLSRMMELAANPTSSIEDIEDSMKKYKEELMRASVDVNLQMGSGKVMGSTSGQLLFLNKAQVSKSEFSRMNMLSKQDRLQSVFASDKAFSGYIKSEKSRISSTLSGDEDAAKAAAHELKTKARMFLFNEDMVDGILVRHPSIGESHARVTGIRRYQDAKQNQRLIKNKKVREFFAKIGMSPTEENITKFLAGKLKDKKGNTIMSNEFKSEFTDIYMSFVGRAGGQANVYIPQSDSGKINISGVGDVAHSYSRAAQMYGDADGDIVSLFMTSNKESNAVMRKTLHTGGSADAFFKSSTEFASIQGVIKKHQNSQAKDNTVVDEILQGTIKLFQGKKVEIYSASLDALRVSALAKGQAKNPELTRQSLAAIDILEELLLKSRTRKSTLNIADEFSKAVFGSYDGAIKSGPDEIKFKHLLKTHAFGTQDIIEATSNLKDFGLSETDEIVKTKISINEILDFIWENYSENRRDKGLTARSLKQISNAIDRGDIKSERTRAMLESMADGTHGLIQASTASAAGVEDIADNAQEIFEAITKNKKTLLDSIKSPKVIFPMIAGLGISAIAMNLFSDGHSNRTLEGSSVSNEDAVSQATLLGSLKDSLFPRNENDYPEVNRNTILDNETSLEIGGQTGRVESTINGISNFQPVKQVIGAMGFKNNHIYIQDNRRPITKNYTDRLKES